MRLRSGLRRMVSLSAMLDSWSARRPFIERSSAGGRARDGCRRGALLGTLQEFPQGQRRCSLRLQGDSLGLDSARQRVNGLRGHRKNFSLIADLAVGQNYCLRTQCSTNLINYYARGGPGESLRFHD
jgi:hypothetical protein